ncbi:Protein IMPACT-A, partial [Stegodyphus mimosarum]
MENESGATNESLQADEIQALSAIFSDEWLVEDDEQRVYSIKISNSSGNTVYFQVTLPENYPLDSPPIYQISAPWMKKNEKDLLYSELGEIYCCHAGESIIYLWIEKIREFITSETATATSDDAVNDISSMNDADVSLTTAMLQQVNNIEFDELPTIEHGEPIIDRKSVFQAHVARVVSTKQVKQVLDKLKENRKIAIATHNIYAYRIARGKTGTFIQDCEDDGETKAGSVLLHLLQILDVQDVLVVVSRWYGGIHLGPDRFKHISNAARILLSNLKLIKEKPESRTSRTQKT